MILEVFSSLNDSMVRFLWDFNDDFLLLRKLTMFFFISCLPPYIGLGDDILLTPWQLNVVFFAGVASFMVSRSGTFGKLEIQENCIGVIQACSFAPLSLATNHPIPVISSLRSPTDNWGRRVKGCLLFPIETGGVVGVPSRKGRVSFLIHPVLILMGKGKGNQDLR